MTKKNLIVLGGVAAVLCVTACLIGRSDKPQTPKLNGEKILPAFTLADVASIEIGDKVKLASGEAGWTIPSLQDYPADVTKIRENLLKLQELKVGQVARGRALTTRTAVTVRAADGRELAAVTLGDRHEKWGHGRYAEYKGTTVLVGDALDAFGDDPMRWCETKIIDTPYVNFKELADPSLTEADLGFATGVVAKVTIAGDTNRTVTVGNTVKGGSDRYLKIEGEKWTFVVPSYSVDSLLPKPEEPKPEEPKSEEAKPEEATEEAKAAEPISE